MGTLLFGSRTIIAMIEAQTFDDLVPNATLGHYTLIEHIADGGMGHVFRGFEASLQRDVAIKVLKKEFASDPEVLGQFEMEAQNIAALRHPNIVPVYFVGHQGELYFFVMPFITGQTLDAWGESGQRLTLEEGRWVFFQAIDALERAFAQNLIHLDIKPSNFLVDDNGTILLTDFGLAKVLGSQNDVDSEDCFGTPAYMCPEQIMRQKTDQRSDIYSLGATLFHLLTGTFLFESDSITELVKAHLEKPFPVERAQVLGLPPGWIHLLQKMTRKNPDERYQHYGELREALENVDRLSPIRQENEGEQESESRPMPVPIQNNSPGTLHGLLGPRFASWTQSGIQEGISRSADELIEKINSDKESLKVDHWASSLKEIYGTPMTDMADVAKAVAMVPEVDRFVEELGRCELVSPGVEIKTRRQAIRRAGLALSGRLLLTGISIQKFSSTQTEFTWKPYWASAVATAVVAHFLRKLLVGELIPGKGVVEGQTRRGLTSVFLTSEITKAEAYLVAAALSHGIGKLILGELAPYPYFAALKQALDHTSLLADEERKIFGMNHHEAGKRWLVKHRLDAPLTQAALYYNNLDDYQGIVPGLIGIATHVVRIYGIGFTGDPVLRVRDIWDSAVWKKLAEQCKTLSLEADFMESEFIPLIGTLPHFEIPS